MSRPYTRSTIRLDRLTRSGIRDTLEVIEECRAHGREVVSVADGFAIDGPAGEIVLAVMAWAAKNGALGHQRAHLCSPDPP